MECAVLMCMKKYSSKTEKTVYISYVWPAILSLSEVWCMNDYCTGIMMIGDPRCEQYVEYGSDRKVNKDIMNMLGSNKATEHLAVANSVCWNGQVS